MSSEDLAIVRNDWAAQTLADAKLREQSLNLIAASVELLDATPRSLERQAEIMQRITGREKELTVKAQSQAISMAAKLIELVSNNNNSSSSSSSSSSSANAVQQSMVAPKLTKTAATFLTETLSSTIAVTAGSATAKAGEVVAMMGQTSSTVDGADAVSPLTSPVAQTQKRQQLESVADSVERLSEIVLQGHVTDETPIVVESRNIQIDSRRWTLKKVQNLPFVTSGGSDAGGSDEDDMVATNTNIYAGPATFTIGSATRRARRMAAALSSSSIGGTRGGGAVDMVLVHYGVDIHGWSGQAIDSSTSTLDLKYPNTRTPLSETIGGSGNAQSTAIPFLVTVEIPLRAPPWMSIVRLNTTHSSSSSTGDVLSVRTAHGGPIRSTNESLCLRNNNNNTAGGFGTGGGMTGDGSDGDRGLHLCPDCRFWDETSHSWSTQGCRAVGLRVSPATGQASVRCECNHLTDFAAQFERVFVVASKTYVNIFTGSLFTLESFLANIVMWSFLLGVYLLLIILFICRSLKHGRIAHLAEINSLVHEIIDLHLITALTNGRVKRISYNPSDLAHSSVHLIEGLIHESSEERARRLDDRDQMRLRRRSAGLLFADAAARVYLDRQVGYGGVHIVTFSGISGVSGVSVVKACICTMYCEH